MAIRVLLVDDVPEVRRMLRTALRFRGVFAVVGEADDGAGALALAERLQPDVVVLDIGLPDLAGREVLTGLRTTSPGSKVIVFSGTAPAESAEIAERVEGYARKGDQLDYLVELLETVGRQPIAQSSCELPADPASAGAARSFTREVVEAWGIGDVVDDVVLVVSELVANAVTHARTACELRISLDPLTLRVEVVDAGRGMPDPLPPSVTRNSGRGLHLVDAVTAAWGVEPEADGGKIVWAELRRPS